MRPRSLLIPVVLWLGLVSGVALAQVEVPETERPQPCKAAEYRQFDFWIGDWEVRNPDGEIAGHNTVERILDSCALKESWRGSAGTEGYSFNTFDRVKGQWHQTWVDDNGLLLRLDGGLEDGSMVLRGEMPARDGGMVATRISWTPKDDGRVRQHWETSKDEGETWQTLFDGLYVPVDRTEATSGE